jgi:DNA-binding helix-turn-helix protein
MADTYLPADVRKRIVDVMRERKMTQRELALRIDVNESTISRFLSGKTEKLSEESVIRIARVFNVSTDFILGTTVIPDKKNYDISELGLSVEAAKNLYTGKVNNDVVNRLLENPRFATVTYMIAQYMDDTLAGGYAAQNQMYATLSSMLLGINKTSAAVQAARTANAMKVPAYQADQTTIQNTFMTVVKEIKKEAGSDLAAAKAISKETTERMFTELTKGQDTPVPTITPEAVADAVTGSVSGMDYVNQEALLNFNRSLVDLLKTTLQQPESQGQSDDTTE